VAIERYEHLVYLKKTLENTLPKRPLLRGWRERRMRHDVVKTDKLFVHLSNGRKVLWADVDAAHMIPMLRHLLSEESLDRKERCKRYVAMAIYCSELSRQNAEAEAQAVKYAKEALAVRPSQKLPISRLLPGTLD